MDKPRIIRQINGATREGRAVLSFGCGSVSDAIPHANPAQESVKLLAGDICRINRAPRVLERHLQHGALVAFAGVARPPVGIQMVSQMNFIYNLCVSDKPDHRMDKSIRLFSKYVVLTFTCRASIEIAVFQRHLKEAAAVQRRVFNPRHGYIVIGRARVGPVDPDQIAHETRLKKDARGGADSTDDRIGKLWLRQRCGHDWIGRTLYPRRNQISETFPIVPKAVDKARHGFYSRRTA